MTLWSQRFATEGHVENRQRFGPPRKTSADVDLQIVNIAERSPFFTATSVARELNLTEYLVRQRLRENGFFHHIPATEAKLTEEHLQNRIAFCEENQGRDWDRIIFSDEKTFRSISGRKMHLWRPKNQRYTPKYVQQMKVSGRISCGIWGFITAFGVGDICEISGRMNSIEYTQVLEDILIPSMSIVDEEWRDNMVFMQDNAKIHTSSAAIKWIREHNIKLLKWPAYSPDLNPIENVWAQMVYNWDSNIQPTRAAVLNAARNRFDDLIGTDNFSKLYASMPKRLDQVLQNNGHWCKY